MRCAIKIDEDQSLYNQSVCAWGEMQSLKEEPAYKEDDITSDTEKSFFEGYKFALDEMKSQLETLKELEDVTPKQTEMIQTLLKGSLCELLFGILDNQTTAGKTMTEEELEQFINKVGRVELFDELEDLAKPEYQLVRRNKVSESRYLKAVRATLCALGYDEQWVNSKVRNALERCYIKKGE